MLSFALPLAPCRRARLPVCCAGPPPPSPPPIAPTATRHSLPTHRERLYLESLHLTRPRGRAPRYTRSHNMSLMAWPLIHVAPPHPPSQPPPERPIPRWAYVVRVRAAKSVLGKSAVVRNRAKRRVRAAAASVMPAHAARGWEYMFAPGRGVMTADFDVLVKEVEACLREIAAWKEHLALDELVREVYCDRYR